MRPSDLPARKVSDLVPYAKNSRTHSDAQIAQIAASISEFGFINPVLIDEASGIVAGHGRVLAALSLGLTEVPVLVLSGLTEAQRKAYVIADNRLALNAGWDEGLLKMELVDLLDEGFDVGLLGFEEVELAKLLEDELLPIGSERKGEGASGVTQHVLAIDKVKVPMTDAEAEAIGELFVRYSQENGMSFGFAAWLIEGKGKAPADA